MNGDSNSVSYGGALSRLAILGGFVFLCTSLIAQQITVYVSSKSGDRMLSKPALRFTRSTKVAQGSVPIVGIDDQRTDQKIIGFGASFLEAGMISLNSLGQQKQEEVLRSLFDPKDGVGFSAMKTVIAGTDFMSAGSWYTYDDIQGDVSLEHFNISRDLRPNGLITFVRRARRYGDFLLQAPMDYPPDWMLDNNQHVKPEYYEALANYYLKYVKEYEKQGVILDYVSLFNEPGSYTNISYPEIRELLKNHVGPLFAMLGLKTKIQLSESPTRAGARRNYPLVLNDPEARKYVSSLPYHGYDFAFFKKPSTVPTVENGYNFAEFKNIAELHRMYPDLPLWMTEVCYWNAGTPWKKPLPRYEFEDGDFWGRQIISDLQAGASGWTYWNMILDQEGGPELVDPSHHNMPNNKQQPLVIINRSTKRVSYTGAFYYLAHFSKFVRPGSQRIDASCDAEGLRCVAFKRPDGKIVVELINSREKNMKICVDWHDRTVAVKLPALSISTLLWS
jgi:glucosylceramidase